MSFQGTAKGLKPAMVLPKDWHGRTLMPLPWHCPVYCTTQQPFVESYHKVLLWDEYLPELTRDCHDRTTVALPFIAPAQRVIITDSYQAHCNQYFEETTQTVRR